MEHENKVVVDLDKCLRPIKQKAYSTMCNMRKQDLIDYIRELEHNYNVAIAFNEQQAQNFEMLLKEQEEKRLHLPKEDAVPVVHGVWLARARKNGVGKCCSVCLSAFAFAPVPECPNCGARMDGEG